MRSIKVLIISIAATMLFFSMVTLFLPSKVTVSKSIVIVAPVTDVAKEIKFFENWKKWYPAFQNGDRIVTAKSGDSSSVVITGKGGKINMTMIPTGPKNIDVVLFDGNKNSVTYQFLLVPGKTGATLLTWNVNTSLPWYPWKKITGIFLDKINGPEYEAALKNLKISIEKNSHAGSPG